MKNGSRSWMQIMGTSCLILTDRDKIVERVTRLWEDAEEYQCIICMANPFECGKACAKLMNFSVRKN